VDAIRHVGIGVLSQLERSDPSSIPKLTHRLDTFFDIEKLVYYWDM
jgi:hypothetical protein